MKLIIEITEPVYNRIINNITVLNDMIPIEGSIRRGIVLPKGHGDLVDIGGCDRRLFYKQCGGWDSLITVKAAFDMLKALPVVIEADKEG